MVKCLTYIEMTPSSILGTPTKILNKTEGPKGSSVPTGNSPPLFLNRGRELDEIYHYSDPVADSYSINWLF